LDSRIQDLDAQTHVDQDSQKCLIASENKKKTKHPSMGHKRCCTFVPFVVSIDGVLGPEATKTLKCIAQLLPPLVASSLA